MIFKVDVKLNLNDKGIGEIKGLVVDAGNHDNRLDALKALDAIVGNRIDEGVELLYRQSVTSFILQNVQEVFIGLHIEIVHYVGRSADFVDSPVMFWLPRIVGLDHQKRNCTTKGPYRSIGDARRVAKDWAEFLGCPICETEGEEQITLSEPP